MNKKLQEFVKRNRKRNAHLYQPELIEGYDYVLCPVSNARKSMIESKYIVKVLGMSVEEFDKQFPHAQKMARRRLDNVKKGLSIIDSDSGLTKHQISVRKTQQKLNQIDIVTGKSFHKLRTQKTRATHMANIDEYGRNGYRRQADARLTTVLPNGLTVEQNAHKKQKEVLAAKGITRVVGASKISKKNLKPLLEYLDTQNLRYYFDKNEYAILDPDSGNYYYYDLTIPDLNMVIEYQSSAWHANPSWPDTKWNTWFPPKGKKKTAEEVLNYDYSKARALYKHRGIDTHYVWEDSCKEDIKGLICLLQTSITKS